MVDGDVAGGSLSCNGVGREIWMEVIEVLLASPISQDRVRVVCRNKIGLHGPAIMRHDVEAG